MRPILIDTNAYAAFMRGDPEIGRVVTYAERLCLCITVLGELLGGFTAGGREARNRAELAHFMASPRVALLPMTTDTADRYALVYAGLRRRGRPIPSNDLWIAASALEHGASVMTLDEHFDQVEGLRVGRRLDDFLP